MTARSSRPVVMKTPPNTVCTKAVTGVFLDDLWYCRKLRRIVHLDRIFPRGLDPFWVGERAAGPEILASDTLHSAFLWHLVTLTGGASIHTHIVTHWAVDVRGMWLKFAETSHFAGCATFTQSLREDATGPQVRLRAYRPWRQLLGHRLLHVRWALCCHVCCFSSHVFMLDCPDVHSSSSTSSAPPEESQNFKSCRRGSQCYRARVQA